MALSFAFPELITPFAHGVDPEGNFKYMRALYGLVVSGLIGVVVTFLTKPSKSDDAIVGLTIDTVQEGAKRFKGSEYINRKEGKKVRLSVRVIPAEESNALSLHPDDLEVMKAEVGDMIYLADRRWWLGGLRAMHAVVGQAQGKKGMIEIPANLVADNNLIPSQGVVIEKIF